MIVRVSENRVDSMNQYDAIFIRKSVKNFRTDAISEKSINQILNFTQYITDVSGKKSVNFEIWSDVDQGRTKEFHFLVKAPYYLVLSSEVLEDRFLNLGFVLEQVALYLTTKDIASNFGGLHKEKGVSGTRVLAVLAFGKSAEDSVSSKKMKRLPLEHLCVFKDKVDMNIRDMISAAILAPSRMNSQPWRFVVIRNRIHVFCRKERIGFKSATLESYHEFDIGMMLAHLLIAGEELWYNTEVVKSENIADKQLKNNLYMFTVIVTEQQSDFNTEKLK